LASYSTPFRKAIQVRRLKRIWERFEATLQDKVALAGKLDPHVLQEMSDVQQQLREFQKWLMHSSNACVISKAQYASYGVKYQTLDSVSRRIDALAKQSTLSPADHARLSALVQEYLRLAHQFAGGAG